MMLRPSAARARSARTNPTGGVTRRFSTHEAFSDRWLWIHRLRRGAPSAPPHRPRRHQRRQDDLRRLGGSAGGGAPPQPPPADPRRHRRCRRDAPGVRDPRPRRRDAPGRREPRRPLDRRSGRFRPDQRRRHLHPAGGGAAALRRPRPRPQSGVPLPPRLHRRGVRRAGPRRRAVHRDHAVRSAQPLFRDQGGVRPSGARLAPHLRPADHRLQHLQQLRPVAIPGEADPAGDAERAGGQGAAGLRRRLQHPRLAVRRGPCRGAGAGGRSRPARRDLRDRRAPAAHQPGGGEGDLRPSRPPPPRPRRPARAADPLRHRPARPRLPLRDRPVPHRGRAGLESAARLRNRPRPHHRLVSGQPGLVGGRARGPLRRDIRLGTAA